jgi:hypothetical protein
MFRFLDLGFANVVEDGDDLSRWAATWFRWSDHPGRRGWGGRSLIRASRVSATIECPIFGSQLESWTERFWLKACKRDFFVGKFAR